MGYFSIKKQQRKLRQLEIAKLEATLAYIRACKAAGTWNEADRMKVMVECNAT